MSAVPRQAYGRARALGRPLSAGSGLHLLYRRKSTSPGASRSEQSTSSAGIARPPSSGTSCQTERVRTTGWLRAPSYAAATTGPSSRCSISRSTARGSSSGPVRQDDERVLDVAPERRQAAAQRGAGPVSPAIALHHASLCGVHTKWVSAGDDDHLGQRRAGQGGEDGREELCLLRAAVPGRRARGEHDGRDGHSLETVAFWISTISVGCSVDGIAELADLRHRVEPVLDLADDRVLRRQLRVLRGDDEELAAARAVRLGLRLRHRDGAERVARRRRRLVDGRVAGAAQAARGRVAALDDEAGHDPVEDRVVVEALAHEADERRGRRRRRLDGEVDREAAAVGLHRDRVGLRLVEALLRLRGLARGGLRLLDGACSRSRPSSSRSSCPASSFEPPPPQAASTRTSASGSPRRSAMRR